jgi:hypothetical protein
MVNSKDREKRTPLHWAAGKNALPCVDALLKAGADVHACDWAEHTPLHWACLTDALESAKAIMAAGGKTDVTDRDKRTPLHWAAERGSETVLKYLISEAKVALDAVDAGGFTALHSAARRGMVATIKLLIKEGANASLAAFNGDTPMDLAADADARKALSPAGGASPAFKRKRTLSSGKVDLEGSLPSLAEALYSLVKTADLTTVRTLCVEPIARKLAGQAAGVLAKDCDVGTMHVCARTYTVFVDLKLQAGPAVHKLVFDEDGLITSSDVLTASA